MNLKMLKNRYYTFAINKLYAGTSKFEKKRKLMIKLGHKIGNNTKIVGPVFITGKLTIGDNCWIGTNFSVYGNGNVTIGNNCDIAPNVSFFTGGHKIGNCERRAGAGETYNQCVGDGVWIGGNVSIVNNISIGNGAVIAACSCVVKSVGDNTLVGGVPARIIRTLDV